MKFCEVCGMDGVTEQIYTPEHDESSSKVYYRCMYCGDTSEGEWYENDEDGWPIIPPSDDDEYDDDDISGNPDLNEVSGGYDR